MKVRRTLIIAEAGVNHNGDLSLAKRLIEVAANVGADFVKFQTFSADQLVVFDAPKSAYQQLNSVDNESQYDMLRRLELSRDDHKVLIKHCSLHGIGFLSTGFDVESIDLLLELGQNRFKIPSGEITNLPYLRHVGKLGKPIILSTGMSTLGEVEDAIGVLELAGTSRSDITVLHCNTEYPTPIQDVNLSAMCTIRNAFDVAVGYSDHTLGIEVPVAAVALGASIIEKHLTLDQTLPGPDHKASMEPPEFASMVACIRNIELALGDGIKRPSSSEKKNKQIARRSLVASKAIDTGENFTIDNIAIKRPGTGISPMRLDEVIGRLATRSFIKDEQIVL